MDTPKKKGPPPRRGVLISDAVMRRVRIFAARCGFERAARRLGVGESTLEAACGRGTIHPETLERLTAALEREERADALSVAS